jgi:hypothetical protein
MGMELLTPGLLGSLHVGWMGMEQTVEGKQCIAGIRVPKQGLSMIKGVLQGPENKWYQKSMHEVESAVGLIIDWQNWAVDLAESLVARDDDRAQTPTCDLGNLMLSIICDFGTPPS